MFRALVSRFLLALMFMNTALFADPIVTGSKPFTFIPGTVISSSQVNADFDYIINQVNTNAAKNGANSSITALLGLTTPLAPSMGGSSFYYATTVGGTVDAITVTATTPAISSFSLVAGVTVAFIPTGTNTISGPTLNVNGTGAVILKRNGAGAGVFNLRPNEIPFAAAPNTGLLVATYDGSQWVVLNPPAMFGIAQTIASAATTDLGLAGSRNASITGNTGITSFGSTCNVNLPIYLVKFTGTPAITYNATSMILPGGSNLTMVAGDSLLAECLGGGNWKVLSYFPITQSNPTVQRFTSGSGNYTPAANTKYIRVRMVGGGGGGGAAATNGGAVGVDSSFGSWTAIHGNGGATNVSSGNNGGAGGTGGVNGTGTLISRFDGQNGMSIIGASNAVSSGAGGSSNFGGGAPNSYGGNSNVAGTNAKANTGSGGAGGSASGTGNGGGGGAGEYVEFFVSSPGVIAYVVGGGGNGGAAGTSAGGNGAAGYIAIEEYNR